MQFAISCPGEETQPQQLRDFCHEDRRAERVNRQATKTASIRIALEKSLAAAVLKDTPETICSNSFVEHHSHTASGSMSPHLQHTFSIFLACLSDVASVLVGWI